MMSYLDHLNNTNNHNDIPCEEERHRTHLSNDTSKMNGASPPLANPRTSSPIEASTSTSTKTRQRTHKWTPVTSKQSKNKSDDKTSSSTTKQTKSRSARKNERKRQRKKILQQEQQNEETNTSNNNNNNEHDSHSESSVVEDETLARALAESVNLQEEQSNNVDPRLKRLRNLRKKLASAEILCSNYDSNLNKEQRQKVDRIPILKSEIMQLEQELEEEQRVLEERQRLVKIQNQQLHHERTEQWKQFAEGHVIVDGYDASIQEQFSCPLCAGPLEAAMETSPCQHIFCRACLEDSLQAAAMRSKGDPEAIVCPMCRTLLWNVDTQKCNVTTALSIRRRMKKKKVKCRCGTDNIALSSLRQHLRHCQQGVPILFQDDTQKKFKHEFEQPQLDPVKVEQQMREKKHRPNTTTTASNSNGHRQEQIQHHDSNGFVPDGYDEEAEIQAAILLSMEGMIID